ncbi:MAG TPA: hypothetical protein VG893_06660 [Terracidiphilus sp.]|nr:hypothetical protein [Terracidiphilus sp.]
MKQTSWLIIAIVFAAPVCHAQFPPKSHLDSGGNSFGRRESLPLLSALKEPSLLTLASNPLLHSYRFLWMRSFNPPIAIRIDINLDGTATLTTKMGNGAGSYARGRLIVNKHQVLSRDEVKSFLTLVDRVNFWSSQDTLDNQFGMDGSIWIIEGIRNGTYHVIEHWSPMSGTVHELGMFLAFRLAKMYVPKREIY